MAWLITIIVLLLFYSLNQVASEEYIYYITANSTDVCTPSCLSLTEFATNFSDLHSPNVNIIEVTLVFSPGIHYLNKSLTVPNLNNFTMISQNTTAQIRCAHYNSQMVYNCTQTVHITNLEFIGCGDNEVVNVDKLVIHKTTFSGQENSGTALELIETTAQIINCTFLSNRNGQFRFWSSYIQLGEVGGAIIATRSNVNISQSIFENNGASHVDIGAIFAEQRSIISIYASTFVSNSAYFGIIYSNSCSITVKASNFYRNCGVLISEGSNITI